MAAALLVDGADAAGGGRACGVAVSEMGGAGAIVVATVAAAAPDESATLLGWAVGRSVRWGTSEGTEVFCAESRGSRCAFTSTTPT